MEALIDNGEENLEPLLEMRDWLLDNRPREDLRQMRLRSGKPGKGPYNIQTRGHLLKMLFEAEKESGEKLITSQELKAIQIVWQMDGFNKNAYKIYYDVYKHDKEFEMTAKDKLKLKQQEALAAICKKNKINSDLMMNLVKNEKDKRLLRKRKSMQKIIEDIFNENH